VALGGCHSVGTILNGGDNSAHTAKTEQIDLAGQTRPIAGGAPAATGEEATGDKVASNARAGAAAGGRPVGAGIGVNSYLWRASLDTLSFMPLASADPFGGTIISDWYAPPETPDERFKTTVYILDKRLRADALRVSVFRQTRGKDGSWNDASVDPTTAGKVENAILTRARQLRLASTGK
jgi:hypothetical protein